MPGAAAVGGPGADADGASRGLMPDLRGRSAREARASPRRAAG